MEEKENETYKLLCQNVNNNSSAFLAMFSCGAVRRDVKKFLFRSYENSQTPNNPDSKKSRKMLVADSGKLKYCGRNYGKEASQRTNESRYFIGIRNKKTRTMTVHGVQLVHCVPIYDTTDLTDEEEEDNKEKTYIEKIDMLTTAFGSKRKRQAMESRLNYAAGTTDDGTALVESIDVSNLKKHDTSVNTPGSQTAQAIPPQNASATKPEDVYDVKDIISLEEFFAIESLAKDLIEATPVQVKQWKDESKYGQLVIQNLQESKSSVDLNKATLLVYYSFLLQVLKLRAPDVKRKDPLPNIPEPCKGKLLDRFTVSSSNEYGTCSRKLPPSVKDKAMAYAMVLALIIEDFRAELPVLQEDFKKGKDTITKIANALGCHIVTRTKKGVSMKVAELKLPLFVPVQRVFAKKR